MLFEPFTTICVQSPEDARRFKLLGVPHTKIEITGNLKFDQPQDPSPTIKQNNLRSRLCIGNNQTVIVAGSTHKGEETILCEAFTTLRRSHPHLILIVAPRDPQRAGKVRKLFRHPDLNTMTLSELSPPPTHLDVVVIDTIGLLRHLYALANMAFVGGSLVPCGGHNPLEPAAYAKPILIGPHMNNFREITGYLLAAGGAVTVTDANTFARTAANLLEKPHQARAMGRRAAEEFQRHRGAVTQAMRHIASL